MIFGLRIWLFDKVERYLDKTLVSLNESLKTFIQEVWQLGVQIANFLSVAILGFIYKPAFQRYAEERNRIKKRDGSSNNGGTSGSTVQTNVISSSSSGIPNTSTGLKSSKSKRLNRSKSKKRITPFVQLLNESYETSSSSSSNGGGSFSSSSISSSGATPITVNNSNVNNSPLKESFSHYSPKKTLKPSPSLNSIKKSSPFSMGNYENLVNINSTQNNPNNLSAPSLLKRKQKRLFYVNRDLVHHHEQITTGFLEDLKTNLLLFFDKIFQWARKGQSKFFKAIITCQITTLLYYIITLPFYLPFYIVKIIIILPFKLIRTIALKIFLIGRDQQNLPNRLINDKELDIRSVREIIEQAGYPYERYHVTTEDGYILLLERIPNKNSKRILYLQHGIFDNSFAWVANGPTQSLAFAAHDEGYDVFLGNLRGNGERLHTENNISSKQYWDFSINEHAFLDIPSFIQVIRQVKIKELSHNNAQVVSSDDINISAVAHSMGAACILMYIVWMRLLNKSHHLSKAILLSPAGYHETAPNICSILAPIINLWLFLFPMHVFRFPSDSIRVMSAKIYHDIINNTPTKDLMVYLVSRFLLGGDIKNHPLEKIHNLAYNTFSGTSVKVYKHFVQMWRGRKFQAFDYGQKGNLKHYGTNYPLNFLDHYDLIDIPIHFIMGLKDNLIQPVNIIKHYTTLKRYHPQNAFLKASQSGHIEFTLGLDDQIMSYILNILTTNR